MVNSREPLRNALIPSREMSWSLAGPQRGTNTTHQLATEATRETGSPAQYRERQKKIWLQVSNVLENIEFHKRDNGVMANWGWPATIVFGSDQPPMSGQKTNRNQNKKSASPGDTWLVFSRANRWLLELFLPFRKWLPIKFSVLKIKNINLVVFKNWVFRASWTFEAISQHDCCCWCFRETRIRSDDLANQQVPPHRPELHTAVRCLPGGGAFRFLCTPETLEYRRHYSRWRFECNWIFAQFHL